MNCWKILANTAPLAYKRLQNWDFINYLLSFPHLPFSALSVFFVVGGDDGGAGKETA